MGAPATRWINKKSADGPTAFCESNPTWQDACLIKDRKASERESASPLEPQPLPTAQNQRIQPLRKWNIICHFFTKISISRRADYGNPND